MPGQGAAAVDQDGGWTGATIAALGIAHFGFPSGGDVA